MRVLVTGHLGYVGAITDIPASPVSRAVRSRGFGRPFGGAVAPLRMGSSALLDQRSDSHGPLTCLGHGGIECSDAGRATARTSIRSSGHGD
jgi:hypothetical protein